MNSYYMDNDRNTEEFSMHNFTMTKSRFIRYGALVIFCASMSMSSMAVANQHPTDVGTVPEVEPCLNEGWGATLYSGAAITLGANAKVFGGIQSVAAATLGAKAEVGGNILAGAAVTVEAGGKVAGDATAGAAATLGANASVGGNVAAGAEVTMGDTATISGDVTGSGNITLGANAKVSGDTTAANSVTLGALAEAGTDVGTTSGPIILGAYAKVHGNATSGSTISIGAGAEVTGDQEEHTPVGFDNHALTLVVERTEELTEIQVELSRAETESEYELAATIATSRAFSPGVYHASALTTAAGVTLTFMGEGPDTPVHWL
ncbi:MAG: putative acyltransferase (DUF342 family), partial [Candidatus Promineifilaceae bacterium]